MKATISILMIVSSAILCVISFAKNEEQDVPMAWYVVLAVWLVLFGVRVWID